jgi:hypothetical protein
MMTEFLALSSCLPEETPEAFSLAPLGCYWASCSHGCQILYGRAELTAFLHRILTRPCLEVPSVGSCLAEAGVSFSKTDLSRYVASCPCP